MQTAPLACICLAMPSRSDLHSRPPRRLLLRSPSATRRGKSCREVQAGREATGLP